MADSYKAILVESCITCNTIKNLFTCSNFIVNVVLWSNSQSVEIKMPVSRLSIIIGEFGGVVLAYQSKIEIMKII